jgi:hypothetical protein
MALFRRNPHWLDWKPSRISNVACVSVRTVKKVIESDEFTAWRIGVEEEGG